VVIQLVYALLNYQFVVVALATHLFVVFAKATHKPLVMSLKKAFVYHWYTFKQRGASYISLL